MMDSEGPPPADGNDRGAKVAYEARIAQLERELARHKDLVDALMQTSYDGICLIGADIAEPPFRTQTIRGRDS